MHNVGGLSAHSFNFISNFQSNFSMEIHLRFFARKFEKSHAVINEQFNNLEIIKSRRNLLIEREGWSIEIREERSSFENESSRFEFLNFLTNIVFPRQRDGRVHLRWNGPRLSGGAGRGLPIADRWILVRHDRIRPRLLQEFQVPADVQQTSPRLQGQRYTLPPSFRSKSSSRIDS